jgi:RsiW-degrading membrane proteinase PrsW (M82 family)
VSRPSVRTVPIQTRGGGGLPPLVRPALWVMLLLIAAGAWRVGLMLQRSFEAYPKASTAAVILFALYAIPFILLLRMIDYLECEPLLLQVGAVAWGGLVATSAAIAGSAALQNVLAKLGSPQLAAAWGPAVAGATVEEILKVAGVVLLAMVARAQINSVVDGFVYGALVGLGFQVVENIAFAVNAVALESGQDRVSPVLATFLLRGFLGGLWSHTLFTALAGAGFAYALVRNDRPLWVRWGVAIVLFETAWGFHFLWNSPLLADGFGYGVLGIVAAMLLKGVPALIVGAILIIAAERREADYYGALLAGLADTRMATRDEIAALVSPRRRVAERRRARERLGRAGARAVRRLQRSQARLAVALSRDPGAEVQRRRREVLSRRNVLVALSLAAGPVRSRRWSIALRTGAVVAEVLVVLILVVGVGVAVTALGGT